MRPQAADEYSAFVCARSAALFRTAYLLTGDHRRAADLVRNALVEVYLHWPRVSAMEQPDGFARRVLVNEVASSWHRRSAAEPAVTLRESTEAAPESRAVWDAVLTLPPRQRAVLVLRYYEDLTDAETARVLGIAVGSVQSHTRAASLRLAGLLAGTRGALGQERAT
jgi:RNA polymerase sigma-70 factor (sigma-E family)